MIIFYIYRTVHGWERPQIWTAFYDIHGTERTERTEPSRYHSYWFGPASYINTGILDFLHRVQYNFNNVIREELPCLVSQRKKIKTYIRLPEKNLYFPVRQPVSWWKPFLRKDWFALRVIHMYSVKYSCWDWRLFSWASFMVDTLA